MTRIEAARRRAAGAKRLAIAVAAAGFLATMLIVRGSHLGHAATSSNSSSGSSSSTSRSESSDDDGSYYGSPSVAPSGSSSAQTQTSVS